MSREASAPPEVNFCRWPPFALDWPSIARRLVRVGILLALGLFFAAAALADRF